MMHDFAILLAAWFATALLAGAALARLSLRRY